jgi:hypothetical protein
MKCEIVPKIRPVLEEKNTWLILCHCTRINKKRTSGEKFILCLTHPSTESKKRKRLKTSLDLKCENLGNLCASA